MFQILTPTPKTVILISSHVDRAALPQLQQVTGTRPGRQSTEARRHLSCCRMAAVAPRRLCSQRAPRPGWEGEDVLVVLRFAAAGARNSFQSSPGCLRALAQAAVEERRPVADSGHHQRAGAS